MATNVFGNAGAKVHDANSAAITKNYVWVPIMPSEINQTFGLATIIDQIIGNSGSGLRVGWIALFRPHIVPLFYRININSTDPTLYRYRRIADSHVVSFFPHLVAAFAVAAWLASYTASTTGRIQPPTQTTSPWPVQHTQVSESPAELDTVLPLPLGCLSSVTTWMIQNRAGHTYAVVQKGP